MSALSWASAAYLIVLVVGYYVGLGGVRRHNVEAASFIFVGVLLATVMRRRTSDAPERPEITWPRWPVVSLAALLLAVAFVLYAPVIGAGLFADDFVLLEAARQGRWTVWTELFRPVIFLVWRALDRVLADVGVALHVFNIALHAVNATLTAALAWRLGLSSWSGMAAGVLFLFFPASVEPVAWPAGVQDVLMTSCVLGFLLLLTSPRLTSFRAVVAVVLLIAACLIKESGVTAIALAALVCVAARAERSAWIALGVATAAVAVMLAVRLSLLPLPAAYRAVPSRYHAKELLVRPFATLVLPFRDGEVAAMPWLPVMAVIVVVFSLCIATPHWNRRSVGFHLVVMSTLFVLASIAAVNTIFYVDGDLLGSRYLYLGSVGWVVLLATIHREVTSRSWLIGGMVAVVTLGCWVTAARAHVMVWKRAAALRELILSEAGKGGPPGCMEILVEGLPLVHQGVPLFINGFPEAMRQRLAGGGFRVASPGTERSACVLVWTGTEFRRE